MSPDNLCRYNRLNREETVISMPGQTLTNSSQNVTALPSMSAEALIQGVVLLAEVLK